MKTKLLVLLTAFMASVGYSQSAWPAQSWSLAANLTSVMNAGGVIEFSGLHWNPENNRLYGVQNDGRVRVLQYNISSDTFTQIGSKTFDGGPEGITQVDLAANEFYTIDENEYEIRKYTHNNAFSSVTEVRHWNLLASPSPMDDTGNTGPEGIVFIPDSYLAAVNFTSSVTGLPYVSTKGMGGLMFIAHQDGGYIWVFDLNPNANNDFAYVGKYRTSRTESCDLAFDRTTGLLYILHNIDENYLETTDLTLAPTPGAEAKFTTVSEHFVSNPTDGNINIEGFALMPKCGATTGSAFLCRDASSAETLAVRQDVLRRFTLFAADGSCSLATHESLRSEATVYPNPAKDRIGVSLDGAPLTDFSVRVVDVLGRIALSAKSASGQIDVSSISNGIYVLKIDTPNGPFTVKLQKE